MRTKKALKRLCNMTKRVFPSPLKYPSIQNDTAMMGYSKEQLLKYNAVDAITAGSEEKILANR